MSCRHFRLYRTEQCRQRGLIILVTKWLIFLIKYSTDTSSYIFFCIILFTLYLSCYTYRILNCFHVSDSLDCTYRSVCTVLRVEKEILFLFWYCHHSLTRPMDFLIPCNNPLLCDYVRHVPPQARVEEQGIWCPRKYVN
jgi:hypothetical protein